MKRIAIMAICLASWSALAEPACYQAAETVGYPAGAPPAGYPAGAQGPAYGQPGAAQPGSGVQPCGYPPETAQSPNLVTRVVDTAKQQAEAEVHYETRRRVRDVFDRLFDR